MFENRVLTRIFSPMRLEVNTVIIPKRAGNIFSNLLTTSFPTRALLHGVG
jgi:hypothetical protein